MRYTSCKLTWGGGAAVAVLGCCAAAATAQFSDFYYDTTQGAATVYTGDLMSGLLELSDIDGRSFRVQRVPGETAFGTFGTGFAALDAELELIDFTSMGMGGPGDIATFSGTGIFGGFDFLAIDELGRTMSGALPELRFVDRTDDPFLPGVIGTGFVTNLSFSDPLFQDVSLENLTDDGTLFTFTMVIPGLTLEEYLASSGLNGTPIPLDTLELHVLPIPAAPTVLLVGAGALAVSRRRRA